MTDGRPGVPAPGEDAPLIQVGLRGVRVATDEAAVEACREALSKRRAARLRCVLEPGLLALVQAKLDASAFAVHEVNAERRLAADPKLTEFLLFLFEPPALRRLVERLTGCPPVRRLTGGVFRMVPGAGHYVRWHGDIGTTTRVAALTVNLGRRPVQGGLFELRKLGGKRVLARFPYDRGGDGILFKLDTRLRHRSTPLSGSVEKTLFTCWFHA